MMVIFRRTQPLSVDTINRTIIKWHNFSRTQNHTKNTDGSPEHSCRIWTSKRQALATHYFRLRANPVVSSLPDTLTSCPTFREEAYPTGSSRPCDGLATTSPASIGIGIGNGAGAILVSANHGGLLADMNGLTGSTADGAGGDATGAVLIAIATGKSVSSDVICGSFTREVATGGRTIGSNGLTATSTGCSM